MPVVHELLCSHFTAYSDEILLEKDVTKVFGAEYTSTKLEKKTNILIGNFHLQQHSFLLLLIVVPCRQRTDSTLFLQHRTK